MLQKYLEKATQDTPDVKVRSYSGRNMYGKTCVAITGFSQECMSVIAMAIVQAHADIGAYDVDGNKIQTPLTLNDYQNIVHSALQYKEDTMGYGIVVYWPDEAYESAAGETVDDES